LEVAETTNEDNTTLREGVVAQHAVEAVPQLVQGASFHPDDGRAQLVNTGDERCENLVRQDNKFSSFLPLCQVPLFREEDVVLAGQALPVGRHEAGAPQLILVGILDQGCTPEASVVEGVKVAAGHDQAGAAKVDNLILILSLNSD